MLSKKKKVSNFIFSPQRPLCLNWYIFVCFKWQYITLCVGLVCMHDDYRERSEVEMRNQRIDVVPVAPADHHVLRTNRTMKSVYDVTLFGLNSTLLLSFNALLFLLSILTTYSLIFQVKAQNLSNVTQLQWIIIMLLSNFWLNEFMLFSYRMAHWNIVCLH